MPKDVEVVVDRSDGKRKNNPVRKKEIPMGSSGAQRLVEEDRLKNAAAVQSTTQALIDEGFLPSRQLLEFGFLDDDLYECLTRMDKKDSATKVKALSDFLELISTKSVEKLLNTRTFWARQFVSFMEDDDPRVRELACRCQELYIATLKKDVVPILKTVLPPWFLAQYQLHSSAATAAKSSFNASFPEPKRPEVVRVAGSQIFNLLERRILPKTSLRDKAVKPKTAGKEAVLKDEEQQRIAEGLEAFSGLARGISEEGLKERRDGFLDMLEKRDFWGLGKLSNPRTRLAFFGFLRAVWERMEDVGNLYLKDSVMAIINNLHEKDARAAIATWDVFLLIISKNPSWSTVVDFDKTIFPKILSLLKNAGFGTASTVFPLLVVFLDKVPNKTLENLQQFFTTLSHGLTSDQVRSADQLATYSALCDCFQYILKKVDPDISGVLVERFLKPLVENGVLGAAGNARGLEVVLKMVLGMMKDEGSVRRKMVEGIFMDLGGKVRELASEDATGIRVMQWVDMFARVVPVKVEEGSRRNVGVFIEGSDGLQELFYQLFRHAFLTLQLFQDADHAKPYLTLLRNINSPVLIDRLKPFVSEENTSSYSLIFSVVLPLLQSSPVYTEILSYLFRDCSSIELSREMFTSSWNKCDDKVKFLQNLEQHGCFFVIEQFCTGEQMEDLFILSEKMVASKELEMLDKLIGLIRKLKGDSGSIEKRLLEKSADLSPSNRLKVCLSLLKSHESNPENGMSNLVTSAFLAVLEMAKSAVKIEETEKKLIKELGEKIANAVPVDLSVLDISGFLSDPSVNMERKRNFTETFGILFRQFVDQNPETFDSKIGEFCFGFTDFQNLSQKTRDRKDVFVVRINETLPDEATDLSHLFWDDSMENAAAACRFSVSILTDLDIISRPNSFPGFSNFVKILKSYIELALGSGAPVVYDAELAAKLKEYLEELEAYVSENSETSDTAEFIQPVEELSELECVVKYSELWKKSSASADESLYRNSIRDRLETILAFADFPRNVSAIKNAPWEKIQLYRIVPSILSERCLDPEYSGLVLDVFGTVLIDWISCLQEPGILEENPKVLVLVEEALEGVGNLLKATESLKETGILWLELTEFSYPRILASLLEGALKFAEYSDEYLKNRPPLVGRTIATVCGTLCDFVAGAQGDLRPVWETLFKLEVGLPERLQPLKTSPPTSLSSEFFRLLAPLLLHKIAHFQLLASTLLVNIMPLLPPSYNPSTDTVASASATGQAKADLELSPPPELLSVLDESGDIVDTILHEVPLGSSLGGVVPFTDSYTYILGYLSTWRCVFAWIRNETNEARQALARYLEKSDTFFPLLDNLIRLIPLDAVSHPAEWIQSIERKSDPDYVLKHTATLTDMEEWAHLVYCEALQTVPMLSRSWFTRKQGGIVRQITAYTGKFVSPGIVNREMALAFQQAGQVAYDNFRVGVRSTAAEIWAEYKVENWLAEIFVKIPKEYPLLGAQVNWGVKKGNSMDNWNAWIMQLSAYIRRQNGTIIDGILEWKRSVDKQFSGLEACAICLSVVEVKTGSRPSMPCRTCHNKFHKECLYRWFNQQVDPTCPLCREPFHF